MKNVFFAILIITCCAIAAMGQSKPADATMVVPQRPNAESVLITPMLKLEDQLKIRGLQYEQDKKLLEIQRLEARYKELQEGVRSDAKNIEDTVRDGSRAAGVDLAKYVFDLDTLKVVPRPSPAASHATKALDVKR